MILSIRTDAKLKLKLRERNITEAVEENRGKLRAVIFNMLRDPLEVEDILQDVFAEFVEAYDVGEVFESAGAWLVRVAKNKVVDRFRKTKTQSDHRFFVQSSQVGEDQVEPGNEWLQQTFREEIVRALERLPAEQRDVFVKHELEGVSFDDIAKETGVSVNTLLSRKRYAVQSMREYLKEIYDELE